MILDPKYTHLREGEHLNPLQELIVPHMEHRDNVLILGKTSSGKSTAVPMLGTSEIEDGKSILYIGSFKALAEEKRDDWAADHCPWKDLPKTAITGDYNYDEEKVAEIEAARLIAITPESLLSAVRNKKSAKATFLGKVGVLFLDEGHLVAEDGRGPTMEASMIEFFEDYPDVRLVVMSGTIPNGEEYAEWMTRLNDKPTHIVKSDYRPVVCEHHYMAFDGPTVARNEPQRIRMVLDLVTSEERKDQQFLVVVFKKAFGYDMLAKLNDAGIKADFHCADIKELNKRKSIERAFKGGSIRVLICTQTLITGINLPARNVILTHVEAGGQDLSAFTIQQAAGRAGRPRFDTEGDIFYFIPAGNYDYHRDRIMKGEDIRSWMLRTEVVATHFLGAVYLDRIRNKTDFEQWYTRTLASVQNHFSEARLKLLLDSILNDMTTRLMIKVDEWGKIELRPRGRICAQMLFDPYTFAELSRNFSQYFALKNPTDLDAARTVARVDKYYQQYLSKWDRSSLPSVVASIEEGYRKHVAGAYSAMRGEKNVPYCVSGPMWEVRFDADRHCAAMIRAAQESEGWTEDGNADHAEDRVRMMFLRVKRGLDWQQARQAIAGFSRAEMRALSAVGLHDIKDVRANPELARQVLKPSRARELLSA